MTILGATLIVFGLIGVFINGSQLYNFKKMEKEIRKEIGEDIDEVTDGISPFVEHNKSLFIFSIAMLGIGLFIILR
jgi:hypothetical protein